MTFNREAAYRGVRLHGPGESNPDASGYSRNVASRARCAFPLASKALFRPQHLFPPYQIPSPTSTAGKVKR